MATTTDSKTIVIVDDELHNIQFLFDFLENKGFTILSAENANEGLDVVARNIYRVIIVDLNIPVFPPLEGPIKLKGAAYEQFPGLYVAEEARNKGYRDRQVILYSVHREKEVAAIALKLGITYLMKGRPQELKAEIESVISFDPTVKDAVK